MRYLEAAQVVLESSDSPLSMRELTEQAIQRGLIESTAKAPERTMATELYLSVRDNPASPFKRIAGPSTRSTRWTLASKAAPQSRRQGK